MFIGIISDTHGLVRPEVAPALQGVEVILHAGDIGGRNVLTALKSIAPVMAVRGNNDAGDWASRIPHTRKVRLGDLHIFLLHDLKDLNFAPGEKGFHIVISGHSHRPMIERRSDVLYINPGSAGPRRFKLPVTVARLNIVGAVTDARIINLL